ncbi:MAG: rhomboid family intramembrane serine protease [Anaerolineales bacterium]|nr:rhomboid family intramembrane serine protease [Anaerolineae bacterium]PWB73109.1 MAG: rhomboid family intramembrane serine protease [Anaerolineales bacterium]
MFPLYDTVRSRRFPLVNWMLIVANALAFLYELQMGSNALEQFIFAHGLVPARLMGDPTSNWSTIYSSMFLHGGWFHIINNMWVLFIFGDNVEARMGRIRYLIFYLLSGTAAGLLQTYVLPASQVPMIGASGAIAGVLGAYLVLFPHSRVASLVPIFFIFTVIEIPAFIYLIFWFVSQLYSGWLSFQGVGGSGIAWWAHIGGFLFGLFMSFVFARRRTTTYYGSY